jgi:hypothetical protein
VYSHRSSASFIICGAVGTIRHAVSLPLGDVSFTLISSDRMPTPDISNVVHRPTHARCKPTPEISTYAADSVDCFTVSVRFEIDEYADEGEIADDNGVADDNGATT